MHGSGASFLFPSGAEAGFREERRVIAQKIALGRLIPSARSTRGPREDDNGVEDDGVSSSAAEDPTCLAYSPPGGQANPYHSTTFLNDDNLILCARQNGIDLIELHNSRGQTLANDASDNDSAPGQCVGTVASVGAQNAVCPGMTALSSGTSLVCGFHSREYGIYDTEYQATAASTTTMFKAGRQSPSPQSTTTRQRNPHSNRTVIPRIASIPGPNRKHCFESLQRQLLQQNHQANHDHDYHDGTESFDQHMHTDTNGPPSWDFLETGQSVLALHIGRERDYFCLHDSRLRQSRTSDPQYSLRIHADEKSKDAFGLACFINSNVVATTSNTGQSPSNRIGRTVQLWDVRYGRRPTSGFSPLPSFPLGDTLVESDVPMTRELSPCKDYQISHIGTANGKNWLHVVQSCIKGSRPTIHWMMDLSSGDSHRIAAQNQRSQWFRQMDSAGNAATYALQKHSSGGILACASFRETRSYENQVEISFHKTMASDLDMERSTRKRKHSAATHKADLREQYGVLGTICTSRITDQYGLTTPLHLLVWNGTGTRLVGISPDSDVYSWSAYK